MLRNIDTTPAQASLMLNAMIAAYHDGFTFTVQGYCTRFDVPDNRHTRAALNKMVKIGLLVKHKTLFSDGHYRNQYAAQRTLSF